MMIAKVEEEIMLSLFSALSFAPSQQTAIWCRKKEMLCD
jgi:hypothetical protein